MSGGGKAQEKVQESDGPPGNAAPRARFRPRYLIAAGILLFGGLVVYMGAGRVGAAFLTIQPLPFLVMMASLAFAMGVRVLKWRIALGCNQNAAALFFLSKGAGDWTPGRAGEWSPLLLSQHRTVRIGAWILYDRLLEVGVTALFGLTGLYLLGWMPGILFAALVVGGLLAAAFMHGALSRPEDYEEPPRMERVALRAARRFRITRALRYEFASFGTVLPHTLPLTLLGKACDLFSVWLLFRAFQERVEAPLIMVTRCARAFIAAVPVTADQTGVPHAAELGMLHEATGIEAPVILAALMAEIVAYSAVFWPLFAFAIWRYRRPETIHA